VLLSLDGTLWVQLINFLIFLLVLNAIFLRPVGAAIAKRRAYIDGVSADIVQYEADIKSLETQAEERRAAARRESDAAAAVVRAAAQNEAATITAEYTARAAAIIDEAHATVARELAAARQTDEQIVASLADTLLERALGPGVSV
jgi:F-type H+-transporting ATPase subunit b